MKLSKIISRTESHFLGALSKVGEALLNPQVRTCSVAVPETYRNNDSENRESKWERSVGDPCPEAVFSTYHFRNLLGSKLEETHHMLTGVQEEIPYSSPGTSSRKEKKALSTLQPQLRSQNARATIEAHHILLAFQQLATNSS